jgi:hypothetical protein
MTVPGDPSASSAPPADPIRPPGSPEPARPAGPSAPDRTTATRPDVELVPPSPGNREWPEQAADAIVDFVDQVKAKTTGPAITAARGLVFGVIVGVLGLVVAVLMLIFLIRLTTDVLELIWDGAGVWLTYLIYGVLFTVVGAVLFGKRHVRGLD